MRPKPRVLVDIRHKSINSFLGLPKRINLSIQRKSVSVSFLKSGLLILILGFTPVVFLNSVLAPIGVEILAQTVSPADREALEDQLKNLEAQISNYETTISGYKKQGNTLNNEIKSLEAKVSKINLEIKATKLSLSKLDREINSTSQKIVETGDDIDSNKEILAKAIQSLYVNEDSGLIEILLQNPKLSDFFTNLNSLVAVQDNLRSSLDKLRVLRVDLSDAKDKLNLQRADVSALNAYQATQKQEIESTKKNKDTLLKVTKGKESEYQKILADTKATAAKIRNRIFDLLGGGELSFEKAYEFAKVAEGATGVRAALILAVLDRESALGQNVGRCKFDQINSATGKTTMNPTRDTPIFLDLTKELGIDANSVTVSCANNDGAYGGAMGPAQFIPSTWNLYKNKISQITGNNPPSPWRNQDAFIATGLYLKDAGAAQNEKIAAARYYCGGSWNRYVCLNVYGKKVADQANLFQKDIDILNS